MKACPNCNSTTFDDMEVCYGCLHHFDRPPKPLPVDGPGGLALARFKVALANLFVYEAVLRKTEGALLTVGCARNNSIVVPQGEVARHQLDIFFSQGQIWAERKGVPEAGIDGIPFTGTRSIKSGAQLNVGDATITLVSG
ncbi:MAG: hypothetical protein LBS58_01250 [Coriobacteriales bacterium]|jgi:hypothetical protein|nr:hypothetical protein [Coriobacteriales bacterium]